MLFSLASIALLAVSVAAQGGFPECSLQCLDPTQSVNGCGPTDNACLCRDSAFINNTTECINTNCEGDDVANAQAAARSLCAAVGVTLTSTPASAPTSSSTSAPAPASSTGSTASSALTSTAPSSSTGSATTSASATAPAQTSNAASFNGVNSFAGIAALGLAALAL